jgi:hypothetical protein
VKCKANAKREQGRKLVLSMGKFIDLTGQRFGELIVLSRFGATKSGNILWDCLCDCGNKTIARSDHLKNKHTQSCGCLVKKNNSRYCTENKITHGKSKTKIYAVWNSMISRCLNRNTRNYKNYGGRGITICKEWRNDFMNFYNWAISNGYKQGLTIDREDVNGNYEPNNCRWATPKQQANNTRRNHYIEYNGEVRTLSEWAERLDIPYNTLEFRLNRSNMTIEKAFTKKI